MKITVTSPGAREKFEEWIRSRGGVQIWDNLNMSNPDAGPQFTPALTEEGQESQKPHWSVARGIVVKDISAFRFVLYMREVKRFRVGIRSGSQGLSLKVTDGGSRRIRRACDKAEAEYGLPSYYRFDYSQQECVIEIPVYEEETK